MIKHEEDMVIYELVKLVYRSENNYATILWEADRSEMSRLNSTIVCHKVDFASLNIIMGSPGTLLKLI